VTELQLDAVRSLADRFNTTLKEVDVRTEPFDLPPGWVTVILHRRGTEPHEDDPVLEAGVSPDGRVHT
tara:strand:+ start:78 stop:281 length:204 start_codon:yes stop_codon:yes gene_type:complete